MLKVPAFQYYEDMRVTVYQDDTKWWKFYMMPDLVKLILGGIQFVLGDLKADTTPSARLTDLRK